MKKFLLSCLFLIVATSQTVLGQIIEPVHFKSSLKELNDTEAEIVFSATIDAGWHVYSTDIGDEGPVRATFHAVKMEGVKTVGSLRPATKPVEKYDEMFGTTLRFFEGKVVFKQKVKFTKPQYVIDCYLEYGACNDQNCLPPTQVAFRKSGVQSLPQTSTLNPQPSTLNPQPSTIDYPLNLRLVYDFATTTPLDEIDFIMEARTYNMNAAREALKGNYGHNLGKSIERPLSKGIFGNSIYCHIISRTAAACDARMGGAMIPVMSNSGSGNQGICATNPVCVYAKENENTEEELIRALMLSHLTAIYIKQSLGRLSALCGCVVASIGSSCGITYLMGGDYERICYSVKNMVANLTGMICDGAKPSCSLKITSGVSTALLSALLAMEGKCVSSSEGIVDDDVDKSIHNLTSIGADAMCKTDDMVLNIMTSKDSK